VTRPLVSVVIPARNEGNGLRQTLASVVATRSLLVEHELEIVIVDDASIDGACASLPRHIEGVPVSVHKRIRRGGVAQCRNDAADLARGDVLFITDGHVRLESGWDRQVLDHVTDYRVLAATIADPTSSFRGHGCSLLFPRMGTRWNKEAPGHLAAVQIPSSAGTVLPKQLFEQIGGYDREMIPYGGAEPEFGVRAWLSGAEVLSVPGLTVWHRFKPPTLAKAFMSEVRLPLVKNGLRFGLLYLSDADILTLLHFYAHRFPRQFQPALRLVLQSRVWERRQAIESTCLRSFAWFRDRFALKHSPGR
jgi:glycosyltransferase involved in cell wall biosynthesis